MKILHVVRQFYPAVGGIENTVLALCRHLQQRGHDCVVVTLNRTWLGPNRLPAQEVVEHIQVFRISFIGRRRLFLAPEVLKHASNYDLIHIHGVDFFVDFLALTKRLYRRPLVVSTYGGYFHTRWAHSIKRIYFRTITAFALSRAQKIICTSQHDNQLFSSIVARRKLTTIGVGIDNAFFSISKQCHTGMLVCIGRVAQNKHIERLIDVLALVRGSIPEAHLIIIGSDWEGLRPELEARAQARGVRNSVQFVGQVPESRLKEYLAQAHLFVMASDYESFGIALLEAMSTGTVVVVNDIDTFHEFIVPGENGFLTNFADLPAAAAVIITALRLDTQQREAIGARARATARQFCWERIAELTENVYRDSAAAPNEILPVTVLGVRIQPLTVEQLLAQIQTSITTASHACIPHVNVHGLNLAYKHRWLRDFLNQADLVFCDGAGVMLAARILGSYIPQRITYADWMWQLAEFAALRGWSFFFLGGQPGVAQKAADRLQARFPGLRIAGSYHGYFDKTPGSAENAAVIRAINIAKPDLLIVGFGMPVQERWLMENWHRVAAHVALTGGAVFDYVSGEVRRAPSWMTDHGLEWLGRLVIEPRRLWRRYLVGNPLFLWRVILQRSRRLHLDDSY